MRRPKTQPSVAFVALLSCISLVAPAHTCKATPPAQSQAVILGGSISVHPANFGKFLRYSCRNLRIRNVGKARLKASHLLRRLDSHILQNPTLMARLKGQQPWLIYLGGLNGIYRPERTRENIAKTFHKAHGAGFRVLALTLPPWGAATDRRWRAYEGLHKVRSTRLVNDFLHGKDNTGWPATRRPDWTVDIFDSELRDRHAALRSRKAMAAAFPTGRYKGRRPAKKYIEAAQKVTRHFMKMRYRGRYHFHPNWKGHRLIARLICAKAPADWGCDCKRLRRAWSKDGRIRP